MTDHWWLPGSFPMENSSPETVETPDPRRGVTAPPGMLQWPPRPSNNLLKVENPWKIPWENAMENAGENFPWWIHIYLARFCWLKPGVFWKTKDKIFGKLLVRKKEKLGCKKTIANLPNKHNKQDHLAIRNNHVLPIRIVSSIQMGRWPLTIGVLHSYWVSWFLERYHDCSRYT